MKKELTNPKGALRGRLDPALPVEGATRAPTMIAFVGLSHLGIVSSIAAASKGFEVTAFDENSDLIKDLKEKHLPILEPDLPGLLAKHHSRLHFTNDRSSLNHCDVIYFSQDVPTDVHNGSDLSNLRKLIEGTLPHAQPEATLVVLSQVSPGFTREIFHSMRSIIEQKKLRLHYQVETLIFGRAVERATRPERVIVGCFDPSVALPKSYAQYLSSFDCPILPMRYESAELAKISINIMLAATLSAANSLADICEGLGADWSEIAPALRLDKRIGPHAYLVPGLGIAGGNIERDLVTMKNLAAETGADDRIPVAMIGHSCYQKNWVLRHLHQEVLQTKEQPVIAVWGLTYKPDTHSLKNSASIALLESLRGLSVRVYDPKAVLGEGFRHTVQIGSALEVCEGADVLVIMTPWEEFSRVDVNGVKKKLAQPVVIDPFAVWGQRNLTLEGFRYSTLGKQETL